jgi:predicted phage terminase large subunit-like protein
MVSASSDINFFRRSEISLKSILDSLTNWVKTYDNLTKPAKFDLVFQSWDTANKATELSDCSVCTTWGYHQQNLYLLDVLRKRLEYPELKRLISSHGQTYRPGYILIEDKASCTQLIQELQRERVHSVTRYMPAIEKTMRMHSVTPTIENGLVYLPEKAEWLAPYLHELTTFPNGKNDDQVDSTSQALDWIKKGHGLPHGLTAYLEGVHEGIYPYPFPPEPSPWQRRF